MYGEAVRAVLKEWAPVTAAMLAGLITAVAVMNLLGDNPAVAVLLCVLAVDVARTYVLLKVSGKAASPERIVKRICVDLGFMALLGLILLVIPLTGVLAVYLGLPDAATAVELLWYYFLVLFIVLAVDLYYMGYLVAVENKSLEEALVESARMFRRDKTGTIKKVLAYWAPAMVYFVGNWATEVARGPVAEVLSWITVIVTVLVVIPVMEAVYAVSCGRSSLKNKPAQSFTKGA